MAGTGEDLHVGDHDSGNTQFSEESDLSDLEPFDDDNGSVTASCKSSDDEESHELHGIATIPPAKIRKLSLSLTRLHQWEDFYSLIVHVQQERDQRPAANTSLPSSLRLRSSAVQALSGNLLHALSAWNNGISCTQRSSCQ